MKVNSKLIFALALLCNLQLFSQFFKGIGVYGALTDSRRKYRNTEADKRQFTPIDFANNPDAYNPPDYIAKERLSWGAGIFAEFSKGYRVRWQTEASYTNKGDKEKSLIDPYTGTRSAGFATNKFTFIQWNNYIKFFNQLGYASNWYYMVGVRLEYKFRSSTPANATFSGATPLIWYSGDVGVGFEFPFIKNINWFNEYHWNPDVYNLKKVTTNYRNRTFEARIGLVYRPKRKSIDDCNAPKYRGPAY
jgi:hypothetical protein